MSIKVRLLCSLVLISLLIGGCRSVSYDTFNYDISQISTIAFVHINSSNCKTIVQTLEQDEFSVFLTDLSQIETRKYWNDPHNSVLGNNIQITFKNGDYHLLNASTAAYYTGGKVSYENWYFSFDQFCLFWEEYANFGYIE